MKENEDLAYSRALVPRHNTLYKIIIAVLLCVIFVLVVLYFNITRNINEDISGDLYSGNPIVYNVNEEDTSLNRQVGSTLMKIDYVDNCTFSVCYPEIGIEEIDDKIYSYVKNIKKDFINQYKSTDDEAPKFTEHVDYNSFLDGNDMMRLVFKESVTNDLDIILSKKEYTYYFNLITGESLDDKHVVISTSTNIALEPLEGEENSDFVFLYSGDVLKYATTAINIREEKDSSSEKIGILVEGEPIEVISGDIEWEKVVYKGNIGYVKAGYLTRKKNLHKVVELEILDRGINPDLPMVAITYDDGPNPNSTPRILDTLEQYGAVATFFDLGQLVNRYPEIVRREEAIGCEVGSHTYSHKNLNTLTDDEIQDDIKNAEAAFINALGHKTVLLRAPYGNANLKVMENLDYPIIKWNVDSLDWKTRNKDKIMNEIRKIDNYDGKIILLHSIYGTTADATEILIPELINNGYQLVTVSELAFYKGFTSLKTAQEYKGF